MKKYQSLSHTRWDCKYLHGGAGRADGWRTPGFLDLETNTGASRVSSAACVQVDAPPQEDA